MVPDVPRPLHEGGVMTREWLARPCPDCGAKPHFACRDEDGYLANPHAARQS
jgi:hypothetical protein